MIPPASRAIASQASRRMMANANNNTQQRRSFVDWMTKYPDKVPELQKIHQDHSVFTWQKIPSDTTVNIIGAGLLFVGFAQLLPGMYKLASGKGKMD